MEGRGQDHNHSEGNGPDLRPVVRGECAEDGRGGPCWGGFLAAEALP